MRLIDIKESDNDYVLTVETGGLKLFGFEISPKKVTKWRGKHTFTDDATGATYEGHQLHTWVYDYENKLNEEIKNLKKDSITGEFHLTHRRDK